MHKSILITILLLTGFLNAQFAEVEVQIDTDRLKDAERQQVLGLEPAIQQFFRTSPWDQDISDLGIPLAVQMVFHATIIQGNETYYQVQAIFSNKLDQLYVAKDVQFTYAPG